MSLSKNFPPVMSLYHSTVPPFILFLRNLHAILTKAQAHASSQGIPESYYLNARLFPDMHGLISQIQRVSDISRLAVRRIGDLQLSPMEDNETNINEMKERLEKTIKVLEDVKEEDLAGKDEKEVDVYLPAKKVTWKPKVSGPTFMRGRPCVGEAS